MMKNKSSVLKSFLFFLTLSVCAGLFGLDYSAVTDGLSDIFYGLTGENEGTTSFRSLLIPSGGRSESLGSAYTGLCNDISFFDYNPAASSILDETEISVCHNSWIADSSVETLAATTRFNNLGVGAKISCFYVPFTEYDAFGTRVNSSYYSETTAVLNASYIIHPGYTFKGIAFGLNGKIAYRAMPDYADNDSGAIISGSGLSQSAMGFMADGGMMLQFNLAKFYYSREANFRVGISGTNIGIAITNFGHERQVKLDDGLPSTAGIGISYKPIRPLTFCLEFRQPFNLLEITEYQMWYAGFGMSADITDFFSILTGFQLKGGNPRFSLGSEFDVKTIRFNVNYTLDLTSSFNPVNRISLSAKLKLGDRGRAEKKAQVDSLYNQGVALFAQHKYDEAIDCWQQALKIDRYFDPASSGIKIALEYKHMLEDYQAAFPNQGK